MKEKYEIVKKWICKHTKFTIACVIAILPMFVSAMVTIKLLPVSSNNDWIGFWGAYFGGIITLIVFWGTLRNSNKEREKEEKERLFNILISDAAYINELQNRISVCSNDDLIFELNKKSLEIKLRLEIAENRNLYSGTAKPIECLDDMMTQIEKIQLLQQNICGNKDEIKKNVYELTEKLCAKGFVFEIKKFIQINNN